MTFLAIVTAMALGACSATGTTSTTSSPTEAAPPSTTATTSTTSSPTEAAPPSTTATTLPLPRGANYCDLIAAATAGFGGSISEATKLLPNCSDYPINTSVPRSIVPSFISMCVTYMESIPGNFKPRDQPFCASMAASAEYIVYSKLTPSFALVSLGSQPQGAPGPTSATGCDYVTGSSFQQANGQCVSLLDAVAYNQSGQWRVLYLPSQNGNMSIGKCPASVPIDIQMAIISPPFSSTDEFCMPTPNGSYYGPP